MLYSCANGQVKFLILNRLQLDSKDDIVDIDAHVELSRKDQWLFVLKRDTFLRPGDAQKQQCHGYWFMLEAEAKQMELAMVDEVHRLQAEKGMPTSPLKRDSSGVDVLAILQGSTGMITGGSGGIGRSSSSSSIGAVDVTTTSSLLKHLNFSHKSGRSPDMSSQSPPSEPLPSSSSALSLASASSASALVLSAAANAPSSKSILDALGAAFVSVDNCSTLSQQQFNDMVASTLQNPAKMQALFASYQRALSAQ